MLFPSRQALAWLKGTQCITNCRYFLPLNPGRVKALYSLPTPIIRCYATDRPVSRPKAHTGRTTSTRKPKPAIAPETATTKAPRKTTATKKKPVAKKTGLGKPKSKAKTKTKRKTKTKAKAKPKPKKKVKKVLTEEQAVKVAANKKRSDLKALKEIALTPPKLKPFTAYQVVFAEDNQKRTVPVSRNAGLATGDGYKSLSPERREVSFSGGFLQLFDTHQLNLRQHYNHIANQNKAANAIQYRQWIESHTPEVIRKANNARKLLRRREKGRWTLLHDDRSVKFFKTGYIYFCSDRRASGDFAGISLVDSAKRMGQEWKELSAEEKKVSQALSGEVFILIDFDISRIWTASNRTCRGMLRRRKQCTIETCSHQSRSPRPCVHVGHFTNPTSNLYLYLP